MTVQERVVRIVDLVGGPDNIYALSHCITRLRFHLKDRSKANDDEIKKVEGVLGIIDSGGQYMIVIGNEVQHYYDAVLAEFPDIEAGGTVDAKPEEAVEDRKKMSILDRAIDMASGIFVPCVSLLAGCGTLQGILALLVFLGVLDDTSNTYTILYLISNSIFYYFPVFVGYNTAKYFGGKPFFGALIALIMIHPDLIAVAEAGETFDFLGIPLVAVNYSSAAFPAIIAAWFGTKVEKLARKVFPSVVSLVFVPAVTLVITVPVALLIIGPVMTWIMDLITGGIFALIDFSSILAGIITGVVWQPLVFLGISKAFVPVFIADLAAQGYDNLIPITFAICAFSQGFAALAYGLKSKNSETRQTGISAFISSLFGITEPAMFGLNVTAKRPFIIGIVSAGVGGLICGLFGGKGYSIASGILALPAMIGPDGLDMAFWGAIIAMVVTSALAFGLTWAFGVPKEEAKA